MSRRFPIFDISKLRQKDVDALENIFSFWRTKNAKDLAFEQIWDLRVRSYLGPRFDNCDGAFDWNLSMKLHNELNAKQITKVEYHRWRKTGVAFTNHKEGDYKYPNRTLISGRVFKSQGNIDKSFRSGYWGDILSGPLLVYGISRGTRT